MLIFTAFNFSFFFMKISFKFSIAHAIFINFSQFYLDLPELNIFKGTFWPLYQQTQCIKVQVIYEWTFFCSFFKCFSCIFTRSFISSETQSSHQNSVPIFEYYYGYLDINCLFPALESYSQSAHKIKSCLIAGKEGIYKSFSYNWL